MNAIFEILQIPSKL